jgi:hypothetical protein
VNPLALLRLSPLGLAPWAIAALAVVAGGAGTLWYRGAYHALEASIARAVAEQQEKDRALGERLLAEQRASLNALHDKTLASLKVVSDAPVTSTCGPVQRDASRGVRAILGGGAAPSRP